MITKPKKDPQLVALGVHLSRKKIGLATDGEVTRALLSPAILTMDVYEVDLDDETAQPVFYETIEIVLGALPEAMQGELLGVEPPFVSAFEYYYGPEYAGSLEAYLLSINPPQNDPIPEPEEV